MNDSEVTRLIAQIEAGQPSASEDLLPLVYQELRRLAQHRLSQQAGPHPSIQATALVHEAYLRLVDTPNKQDWDSKGHFFAAAAEAMRRIMVERARRQGRLKHGGQFQRVDLSGSQIADEMADVDLLALDEALGKFEKEFPERAKLIKLRFFAGFSENEAADALGISRATASRHWTFGRIWLFNVMSDPEK